MVGQKAGVQAISVFFYPRSARFRVAWQVIWKAGASDWQTTSTCLVGQPFQRSDTVSERPSTQAETRLQIGSESSTTIWSAKFRTCGQGLRYKALAGQLSRVANFPDLKKSRNCGQGLR
jgi:hypothetical protein